MKKTSTFSLLLATTLFFPLPTFAAMCKSFGGVPETFQDVICIFLHLISAATPVVAALALLVFFWGLARFILKAGDESAREEGKKIMLWGIIALFVMVSIWGILALLIEDFTGVYWPTIPQLPS